MYKAIIFDYGNTLIRTSSLTEALNQTLDSPNSMEIGISIEETISKLYHPDQIEQPDWIRVWENSFSAYGIPFTESIGRQHLINFTKMSKTLSYTIPLLSRLKNSGIKIALLSNVTGVTEIFTNDLKNRQIDHFFDVVAWSCDIGFRKPSLQSFMYIVNKLDLLKSEIIMVGDSEIADIQGAKKAGLDCIKIVDDNNLISDATYVVSRKNAFDDIFSIVTGKNAAAI